MDTRTKILTGQSAAERYKDYRVVLDAFDVLTPGLIRRLREISAGGGTLIAAVPDRPDSLLPLRARVELAASLAMIDCVLILSDAAAIIANASEVFDEREAGERRTAGLIRHVQQRSIG